MINRINPHPHIRNITKIILNKIYQSNISKKLYEEDFSKRRTLNLNDINNLSRNFNIFSSYTYEVNRANDYYGHAHVLKHYLKLKRNYQFKFSLEHGVSLTNHISNIDFNRIFDTTIVSSKYRADLYNKIGMRTYCIGPYIYYAKSILNKKTTKEEKARLKNNLLVFPSHSTPDIDTSFDTISLCESINKIKKHFDSIRICLYWKDVLRGVSKHYQDFGFETVTAGHVYDLNFLPRLKSLIETSSITCSNDIGTQLGYSIFMKKPHFIIKQDLHYVGTKSEVVLCKKILKSKPYIDLLKAFDNMQFNITPKQQKLVSYYWGFDQIKSSKELRNIVDLTEKLNVTS
jgi:hypothetical protein